MSRRKGAEISVYGTSSRLSMLVAQWPAGLQIQWALPVPSNPKHCIYVWLDALTVYLTGAGYPQQKDGEQLHASRGP